MTHEEVRNVLPWYANKRLDASTSRRVEAHLSACAICRGDVDGLNAVLAAHERSMPERPIDEARLDALFGRIDRYEAEQRRVLRPTERKSRERKRWLASALQWITTRPTLAAGSLAAVLLAVFAAPALFQQPVEHEYSVLSTKGAEAAPFIVRLSFNSAPERAEVERVVAASIDKSQPLPSYRIEQHSPNDYRIVFESKPPVAVVGQLLTQLASTSNVASATIDEGSAPDAAPH